MFQIENAGVLNGQLVFPEHVRMNIKNIGCVYHHRRLLTLPCKFTKHKILRRVCGNDKHIRYF
jgi:hypothetical protein